jgi:hypothetical protein
MFRNTVVYPKNSPVLRVKLSDPDIFSQQIRVLQGVSVALSLNLKYVRINTDYQCLTAVNLHLGTAHRNRDMDFRIGSVNVIYFAFN